MQGERAGAERAREGRERDRRGEGGRGARRGRRRERDRRGRRREAGRTARRVPNGRGVGTRDWGGSRRVPDPAGGTGRPGFRLCLGRSRVRGEHRAEKPTERCLLLPPRGLRPRERLPPRARGRRGDHGACSPAAGPGGSGSDPGSGFPSAAPVGPGPRPRLPAGCVAKHLEKGPFSTFWAPHP